MKLVSALPLRSLLPLLCLGLAAIVGTAKLVWRARELEHSNTSLMIQRAGGLGRFVVPELTGRVARGSIASGDPLFERLRHVPHLQAAFVCDDSGRILAALDPEWQDRPVGEVAGAALPVLAQARQSGTEQFLFAADQGTLWAAFPVVRASADAATPPAAWFCTQSDVAAQLAPMLATQRRGTAFVLGATVLCCLGLWWLLDRLLCRRVSAIIASVHALAARDFSVRTNLAGADELTKIGAAIDGLAAELLRHESHASAIFTQALDCIVTLDDEGRIGDLNPAARRELGWDHAQAQGLRAAEVLIPPAHAPEFARQREAAVAQAEGCQFEMPVRRADGSEFPAEIALVRLQDGPGSIAAFIRNIAPRKKREQLLEAQRQLLADIAAGQPLADSLAAICRLLESQMEGLLCSVLLVDEDGARLRHGAAPSLPAAYCAAIDGVAIGPASGSCGKAAFRKEAVIVTDIASDPLWADFKELALAHGLRACFSMPIAGPGGEIWGTFACYFRIVGAPQPEHRPLLAMAESLVRLAIQRNRAEAALRKSEERFRLLVDHAPEAVVLLDVDTGRFSHCNPAAEALFKLSAAELARLGQVELSPPLQPDGQPSETKARALIAAALAGEKPVFEWTHRDATGRDIPCEVRLLKMDFGGRTIVRGSVLDITERKQAEAQIQRLAAFPELNPNPVLEFDAEGRMIYHNQAARSLSQSLGLPDFARLLPEETAPIVRHCLATGQPRLRLETAHAGRTLSWSFYPIRESGTVHCYVGDITERLKLEEQFRQAQKMEAIGQLAGGVAHDFNNILAVLMMQTNLLQMKTGLDGESRRGLDEIARSTQRAANLTRQLLLFSRHQAMQPRDVDLNQAVTELTKMLQRIIGEDVRLQLRLHPTPLRTHADPGMLDQVVMNLAVNARDAMPAGGHLLIETLRTTVDEAQSRRQGDAAPGDYVGLRVSDTGCGIPPEVLPRIFEPFFTTKERGKGTGLGLATVFGIVKQHGGWLTVASEPGQGATFHVWLPAAKAPAPAEASPPSSRPRVGSETILLVEDDPAVRAVTRAVLERHGYRVLLADNGPAAIALWEQHRDAIDLLYTDMVMPEGMSGRELAARLRESRPDLAVILTSGYSADLSRGRPQLKRQRFIQKPAPADAMLETIRACLDER